MGLEIGRYPELAELRAVSVGPDDRPWIGRYYTVEAAPAGARRLTVLRDGCLSSSPTPNGPP
jgi:hypothetical protein